MPATAAAWDPARYHAFAGERLRPALDLLARIPLEAPRAIADLGCGTGTVTRFLAERWPAAAITGIDASPEMLAEARREGTRASWVEADLATWEPDTALDLVFSNAALHWLDDHPTLFDRLVGWLRPGGVLAVQMPCNHDAPSHTAVAAAANAGPWRDRLRPLIRSRPVAPPEVYAERLACRVGRLDIWETTYLHILAGGDPVLAWISGTALRPFLAALSENERDAFVADCRARLALAYPRRADGHTIFPFRRLFIVATR